MNRLKERLDRFASTKAGAMALALVVMALWGSLFPAVKIGYRDFGIDTGSVADILMFAGLRFAVCGLLITVFSLLRGERPDLSVRESVVPILLVALFAVVLHYTCNYVGLSVTDSSKTAVLKQTGSLIYVGLAFLFVKDERFSPRKLVGAILGLCGIAVMNLNGGGFGFSLGDLLILGASAFSIAASVLTKKAVRRNPPVLLTGVTELLGGGLLMLISALFGGCLPDFRGGAVPIFVYICGATIVAYCLWYYVIGKAALSRLFVLKFSESLFACLFGALLLGEDILRPELLAAVVLIGAGILISERSRT